MDFADRLEPGRLHRPVADPDLDADPDRWCAAEEEEVTDVAGKCRRRSEGEEASQGRDQDESGMCGGHARASVIGRADGSAIRIGRPTSERFCFDGSIPSALQMVAIKSGTATGRSSTDIAVGTGAADHLPPLDPATAQNRGPGGGEVVAAGVAC